MAILNIKNAVVERVFSGGKGYAIAETFTTRDGEAAKKPYTAWFDEPQEIEVGATGSWSGLYSDKIEDFEGKEGPARAIRRNLNSARFEPSDDEVGF